jgi:hypothetical protein
MFQTVQHPELGTLGLVAIRDFLKKRARYLRLVAQNSKADGVNVMPITVVASIDPELLEKLIDMEKIDADSVDDRTDESVIKYLESAQERDESATVKYIKAEVLAQVSRYALLRMRPLSISCAEGFVIIPAEKSIMTNLASETIVSCSAARANVVLTVMSTITVFCSE